MASRPFQCQEFVAAAVLLVHQAYPSIYLTRYMDDILLAHEYLSTLYQIFIELGNALCSAGLVVASDKL